nr:MAG TPA: Small hydrophilic plant seed protein [Caudoviricetes sp.]
MAGNHTGGLKARDANLKRNPNFYRDIGRIGGKRGKTGGFASEAIGDDGLTGRERAKVAGKKGGLISKRGKSKKNKTGQKPNA